MVLDQSIRRTTHPSLSFVSVAIAIDPSASPKTTPPDHAQAVVTLVGTEKHVDTLTTVSGIVVMLESPRVGRACGSSCCGSGAVTHALPFFQGLNKARVEASQCLYKATTVLVGTCACGLCPVATQPCEVVQSIDQVIHIRHVTAKARHMRSTGLVAVVEHVWRFLYAFIPRCVHGELGCGKT